MSDVTRLGELTGQSEARRFVVPWSDVERALGTPLPDDYKEFVYHFGPGSFGGYVTIHVPGIENSFTELGWRAERLRKLFAESGEDFARPFASALYPRTGGALLFGTTTMGENFYWLTDPASGRHWPVVVEEPREAEWHEWSGNLASLLLKLFIGELELSFLNVDFDVAPRFIPGDGLFRGARGERLRVISQFDVNL